MATHLTVMTRKGQITIPADVRRALGLKQGDKVAVSLDNGRALLMPYGSVVARTAGILRDDTHPTAPELESSAFEQAVTADVVRGMGA